jgi:hypothetical protein
MERSAAAGTLFRDHDSDDVAKAAACGFIGMSAAMNQDM